MVARQTTRSSGADTDQIGALPTTTTVSWRLLLLLAQAVFSDETREITVPTVIPERIRDSGMSDYQRPGVAEIAWQAGYPAAGRG